MIKNTSKYPDKLSLKAIKDHFVDYDYEWCPEKGQFATTYCDGTYYNTAEHFDTWIEKEGWYELVKETPHFPDSFQFTHDTTSQLYEMTKLNHHNLWACTQPGLACVGSGATYTAEEIAGHFARGTWKEVSDTEPVERELVFPMTVEIPNDSTYYFYKENNVTWLKEVGSDWVSTVPNLYSDDDIHKRIKEGTWIVKSVGPQKAPEATPSVSSPSGAPTSPPKPLAISVQSEQFALATERANELAEACERVNIALESFQAILKSMDVSVDVV